MKKHLYVAIWVFAFLTGCASSPETRRDAIALDESGRYTASYIEQLNRVAAKAFPAVDDPDTDDQFFLLGAQLQSPHLWAAIGKIFSHDQRHERSLEGTYREVMHLIDTDFGDLTKLPEAERNRLVNEHPTHVAERFAIIANGFFKRGVWLNPLATRVTPTLLYPIDQLSKRPTSRATDSIWPVLGDIKNPPNYFLLKENNATRSLGAGGVVGPDKRIFINPSYVSNAAKLAGVPESAALDTMVAHELFHVVFRREFNEKLKANEPMRSRIQEVLGVSSKISARQIDEFLAHVASVTEARRKTFFVYKTFGVAASHKPYQSHSYGLIAEFLLKEILEQERLQNVAQSERVGPKVQSFLETGDAELLQKLWQPLMNSPVNRVVIERLLIKGIEVGSILTEN